MLQATASGLSLQTPAGHFGGKHLALAEISLWPSLSSGWLGAVPPDALLVQWCYQAKRAGETRGEWALQSSQLCLHLLQSWLGLHIAWTQAKRRPPAENQQLVCQVLGCRSMQSANQISLVAAWTFLGNLVLNTLIIIFFPVSLSPPDWQNGSGFSSPCSTKPSDLFSAAAFPAQQLVRAEPMRVGAHARDRGVQCLDGVVQQLKSCLWYRKYESQKLFKGFPSQTLEHILFPLKYSWLKTPDSVIY